VYDALQSSVTASHNVSFRARRCGREGGSAAGRSLLCPSLSQSPTAKRDCSFRCFSQEIMLGSDHPNGSPTAHLRMRLTDARSLSLIRWTKRSEAIA